MDNPITPFISSSPTSTLNITPNYDSRYQRIKYHEKWAFIISLIFLIVAVAMIVVIVLYFLFWKPTVTTISCSNDNNCGVGQICQAGFCVEKICTSDSDCNGNGLCINSYCTTFTCQIGNDCINSGLTGTACVNGSCIKLGTTCQSNNDCLNLSCMNQQCVQCLSNSSCPIGQGCLNQSCRYPYDGETGTNMINYTSPAQNNGNITAPPGYFCPVTICGTGPNNQDPINCDSGTTGLSDICPSSCPFCVNSVCRCTQGDILESCQNNSDCSSGICSDTDQGKLCIPPGGDCISNYNGTGGTLICPISRPYCVNGTCSQVSLGAVCGITGLPPDLCSNPQSLGVAGPTGITPNGMGFFCVNGTCQENPGQLNSQCSTGSCGFIENGILVCLPIQTPSIPEMRCLVESLNLQPVT